jgi:hypothetical protein
VDRNKFTKGSNKRVDLADVVALSMLGKGRTKKEPEGDQPAARRVRDTQADSALQNQAHKEFDKNTKDKRFNPTALERFLGVNNYTDRHGAEPDLFADKRALKATFLREGRPVVTRGEDGTPIVARLGVDSSGKPLRSDGKFDVFYYKIGTPLYMPDTLASSIKEFASLNEALRSILDAAFAVPKPAKPTK